ncbi:PREDICTED: putative dual specificity protein phosphatase DSP8 isoform X2 [Tarenaya hassleriana]|uniref:putative dual specificity protein phosphatase DSP8 isoform X2 n=1 Tax=Tarenaya hassleriana TaxID=28532 RepID=UPI00053C185F|nr:PREDICTED: putative dual specificity protein phosphatase DSP8 isoform X2 [Tarenaya hassleriana]
MMIDKPEECDCNDSRRSWRNDVATSRTKTKKKKKKVFGFKVDGGPKRALIGAGGRILFYPTLLYNLVRFKLESEFRWWDRIDQYLLMGAVPFRKDVLRLKRLGVGGVITLNEPHETLVPSSLYREHGMEQLVIPTRDYLFAPSVSEISRAVDFIHKNSLSCKSTYVHCKAGRGRSTTVVLCYLIQHKNMTPTTAFEYVRSIRPRVLLHPSQRKVVEDYSRREQIHISTSDQERHGDFCDRRDSVEETGMESAPVKSRTNRLKDSCSAAH